MQNQQPTPGQIPTTPEKAAQMERVVNVVLDHPPTVKPEDAPSVRMAAGFVLGLAVAMLVAAVSCRGNERKK